jgi:hypothetical protein
MGDLGFFVKIAMHGICVLAFNRVNKERDYAPNPTRRLPP